MPQAPDHSRLLTLAARAHLAPLGCRQKGRSRFWFDDHGWWAATVEFQPSSWSKGSYLNIGAMWFWHPADHWVFNEFDRVAPFQEFRDDAQFGEVASQLAERAASQVIALREKFDSIESVARYLTQKPADGLWPSYQAAIAASLIGDAAAAKAYFQAVAAVPAVAPWQWIGDVQARAKRLFESFTSIARAREVIAAEVARTREKLGLPELSTDTDLWAPTGRIAAWAQTIQLTLLQIAHAITALRAHVAALEKKGGEDPDGGEYEDVLIAESILKALTAAGAAADAANRPG
jgi:hypothetical protein